MEIDDQILLCAVAVGVISAASLPLGSVIGLWLPPRDRVVAALAAFGAGALLAALAVELVAPTLAELEMAGEHGEGGGHARAALLTLIAGAALGGLLFVGLDRALSERGAFLRKLGSTITHFRRRSRTARAAFLSELCSSSFLRRLPAPAVAELTREIEVGEYAAGETLFSEGERADYLHFIRRGEAEFSRAGEPVATLGAGELVGEIGVLTDAPRPGTVVAKSALSVLKIPTAAVAAARQRSPELDTAVRELAKERLERLHEVHQQSEREQREWERDALSALATGSELPTPHQLRTARAEHAGAGLAVWLGILLDGIPESIVIGASFAALVAMRTLEGGELTLATLMPYTLIAGLFLSNLPEAMSSSIAMRRQGFSAVRVLSMWMVLVVITGVGAGIGFAASEQLPALLIAGIEGLAAGAMLTAIASTMIPEAVHLASGHTVGLGTLAGFLSAVAFKLLE